MPTAVETCDLAFRYPGAELELRLPDLRVERGEQVAIVGPSGCGKTTLINLLAGILQPSSGSVRVEAEPVSEMNDAERRAFRIANIGFIFQAFELIDYLCVEENIILPYLVNPALRLTCEVRNTACELAASVGLGAYLKRRPSELSQGEQQRLAICRALVTEPGLILADEPTGNLDAASTTRILDLIQSRARERNTTLLMITHDQGLLERFDRVIHVEG